MVHLLVRHEVAVGGLVRSRECVQNFTDAGRMAFCEAWLRHSLNVVPGPYVSDVRVSSEVNVVVTEGFTFVEDNMAVSNFPGLALSDWEEHWTLPTHSEGAPTVRPAPTTWRAEQLAEHPWAAEYVRRGTARSSTDTPEVEDDGTSDDEISARWTPRSAFGLDGVVQSDAESVVMAEEWCSRMQFYFGTWLANGGGRFVFSDANIASYEASDQWNRFRAVVPVGSPAHTRALVIESMRPTNSS